MRAAPSVTQKCFYMFMVRRQQAANQEGTCFLSTIRGQPHGPHRRLCAVTGVCACKILEPSLM